MTCEDANVTIEFIDLGLEIRPLTMDFRRDEGLLDSLRAKFSNGVSEYLQPHTEDGGDLNEEQRVRVLFDDEPAFYMMYVPDGVRFGMNNVHIEFFDLQRSMTKGTVDMQRDSIKLKEAYREVYKAVPDEAQQFEGIEFTGLDAAYDEVLSKTTGDALFGSDIEPDVQQLVDDEYERQRGREYGVPPAKMGPYIREIERRRTANIIDGHLAVDLNQVSPYEAMVELNQKFAVHTWTGIDGKLWVGTPETTANTHLASGDDSRIWRLIDHDIRPPDEPVRTALVRGKWVDDPNEGLGERAAEAFPFVGGDNDSGKDYRAEGVAYKAGVTYGRDLSPVEVEASRDMLADLAENKLNEAVRDSWDGQIDILPSKSGTDVSDPRFVQIGDTIILVPPDHDHVHEQENLSCDWPVKQGVYLITGIRHRITGDGEWILKLNVLPYPEISLPDGMDVKNEVGLLFQNTKSYLRFFDPAEPNEPLSETDFEEEEAAAAKASFLRM